MGLRSAPCYGQVASGGGQQLAAADLAACFLDVPDLLGGDDGGGVVRLPGGVYLAGQGFSAGGVRPTVASLGAPGPTGQPVLATALQKSAAAAQDTSGGPKPMAARGNAAVEKAQPPKDPFANLFS